MPPMMAPTTGRVGSGAVAGLEGIKVEGEGFLEPKRATERDFDLSNHNLFVLTCAQHPLANICTI